MSKQQKGGNQKTSLSSKQIRSQARFQAWKSSSSSRATGAVSYSSLNGGRRNPGQNPPPITYQPWNHITLAHPIKSAESLKIQDIKQMLRNQVDPTKRGLNQEDSGDKQFVVQLRFKSFSAWNLSGSMITLSVDDFLDIQSSKGGREQLCGLIDTGSAHHTPAIGFQLPLAHRQHVVRTDDQENATYLLNIQMDTGAVGMLYIYLSYRFDGPVTPPTLHYPLSRIADKTDEIREEVAQQRKELGGINFVMDALSESIKSAVISVGADQLALLVSTVLERKVVELGIPADATETGRGSPAPSTSSASMLDDNKEL